MESIQFAPSGQSLPHLNTCFFFPATSQHLTIPLTSSIHFPILCTTYFPPTRKPTESSKWEAILHINKIFTHDFICRSSQQRLLYFFFLAISSSYPLIFFPTSLLMPIPPTQQVKEALAALKQPISKYEFKLNQNTLRKNDGLDKKIKLHKMQIKMIQ